MLFRSRIAEAKVTEGCVAFYNAEILKLKDWLMPNRSLVVIAKNLNEVNRESDVREVANRTLQWLKAWKNRNVEWYIDFYDKDFAYGRKNRSGYRRYKNRVFKSYKKMVINTNLIRVVTHPKYAITFMNQDFYGDARYQSLGRKILYWKKNNGDWAIIKETFEKKRFKKLKYSSLDILKLTGKPVLEEISRQDNIEDLNENETVF